MKLFKWFFDGTSAEEEHDSSADTEVEVEESEVGAEAEVEPEVDEFSIEEDYSEFDVKSPFLFNKILDGDVEEESEEVEAEEAEEAETEETEEVATEKQEPNLPEQEGPYRTLKYHGQEIPVQSEEEFVRLASQGLDYTRKTQQIAPYRSLVEQISNDADLAAKVLALVETGTIPGLQQARTAPQTPEPDEPNDDETWDEFIERRDDWRKEQSAQPQTPQMDENELFMQRFNAALEVRKRQEIVEQVARKTITDPEHEKVIGNFQSQLTPAMLEAMNKDVLTYQIIYDQLRERMYGKGQTFFYKQDPSNTPEGQPVQQEIKTQPAPAQSVKLKTASSKAPYVESGRGQKVTSGKKRVIPELPDDIWSVSPSDFDSFVEKQIQSR